MKNKKIVINIDVDKKKKRKGFKNDIKENVKNTENNKKSKKNSRKSRINEKKSNEYIEKQMNNYESYDESNEEQEIEYINKKELKDISEGINIVNKQKVKEKNAREKRIGKTLKEVEIEELEENKKEVINFKPIVLSFVSIILIIAIYIFFEYGPIFGVSINKYRENGKEEVKVDIVSTEEDFYAMYNEDLLVYSNQVLSTYNSTGKKTWNYTLDQMFTPNIYIKGKYMIVSNNTSGNIYMFESKKEILNKKIDGKINNIYISDSGIMAIEYASSGYKKNIGLYDKSGRNLYNAHLENDTIADIEILENGSKILVAKINTTSFKAGIELQLIDVTKQEDNIKVIAKLDNNILYDLTIQAQNIIMLLDNKLTSININTGELKDIKKFDSSQMLHFSINGNYYTCVEKELNSNSDEYIINNVRLDGTNISSLKISNSPKILLNSGLLNYFIYQDEFSVVNKWGVEVKKKGLTTLPRDIIVFNKEKSLALIYSNIIHIENL